MGLWSRSLDATANSLLKKKQKLWFFRSPSPKPRHFATDGFHPGRIGYAQWAEYLGRSMTIKMKLMVKKR
jgi:lysophospholipase L1-like esterase